MARLMGLVLLASLAGCAAVQEHRGPCDPVLPLLVVSGSAALVDTPAPEWTVVWDDGRTETWTVEATLRGGPAEASSVVTRGGLDPGTACGVAAFHGSYPGERFPPAGFPDGPWQLHLEVTRVGVGSGDVAPLVSALRGSFASLPEDASIPDCADGRTLAYSAHLDGVVHYSRATCQGTPEFEAFTATVHAWLADTR